MIPNEITGGDSVSWYDDAFKDNAGNDISPGDWTLKYAIRGAYTKNYTATVVDSRWLTSIPKTDFDAVTSKTTLYWQAFAEKGSERVTLGSGQLIVNPNIYAGSGASFDGRSQAQKDLDAVQSAIRAMISGGAVQKYMIGNREVQKMQLSDLYTLESRLKSEVAKEQRTEKIRQGLGDPRNLYVRFRG